MNDQVVRYNQNSLLNIDISESESESESSNGSHPFHFIELVA